MTPSSSPQFLPVFEAVLNLLSLDLASRPASFLYSPSFLLFQANCPSFDVPHSVLVDPPPVRTHRRGQYGCVKSPFPLRIFFIFPALFSSLLVKLKIFPPQVSFPPSGSRVPCRAGGEESSFMESSTSRTGILVFLFPPTFHHQEYVGLAAEWSPILGRIFGAQKTLEPAYRQTQPFAFQAS